MFSVGWSYFGVADINDYYAFGLEHGRPWEQVLGGYTSTTNPYLYNGKEMDRMHGFNQLDYGARWYDPSLGRWGGVMDPLAERYYGISPYVYCLNNPVNRIDPDGRFSMKWMANLSRGFYNLTHKEKADPIIENKEAKKAVNRFTYQTHGVENGEATVTIHSKFSKSAAQDMQNVGDGAALVGLGLTVSVVGAETGVPLAAAGTIFSGVGSAWETGIDYLNGDLSNVNKKLAFYISGKIIEKGLNKVLPGGGKTLYQDGFNLGTEIIKQGTALKVNGIERIVDAKNDIDSSKKKENK